MENQIKILLGIPTNRLIKPKTVQSLLDMVAYSKVQYHIIVAQEGFTIAENRNYLAFQALKNNCTHLLFVDDDAVFPANSLEVLLAHNKDIVGLAYNSRTLPLTTNTALMDEQGNYMHPDTIPPWKAQMPDHVFKCYALGGGTLLINTKVFEVIDKPWFNFEIEETGKIKIGEDAWFCNQAKKKGYDIWCDPRIKTGHIGDYIY